MQPYGLIHVAIPAFDLAGEALPRPADVVTLGMNSPSAVVGQHEQGIDLCPVAGDSLVMHFALFHPFGDGWTLLVVGKNLGETFGINLELPRGRGQGIGFRVFVKFIQARRIFLPVLGRGEDEVFLLLEVFLAGEVV